MNRAEELRDIYDTLRSKLADAPPSGAAQIAAQLRQLSALLETLEEPEEVSLVDELAAKRAKSGSGRPPARRRKSG